MKTTRLDEKIYYYGFTVWPDVAKTEEELLVAVDKFKQSLDALRV